MNIFVTFSAKRSSCFLQLFALNHSLMSNQLANSISPEFVLRKMIQFSPDNDHFILQHTVSPHMSHGSSYHFNLIICHYMMWYMIWYYIWYDTIYDMIWYMTWCYSASATVRYVHHTINKFTPEHLVQQTMSLYTLLHTRALHIMLISVPCYEIK